MNKRIFAINFEGIFIFWKINLPYTLFLVGYFCNNHTGPIKCPVWTSTHPKVFSLELVPSALNWSLILCQKNIFEKNLIDLIPFLFLQWIFKLWNIWHDHEHYYVLQGTVSWQFFFPLVISAWIKICSCTCFGAISKD